MEKMKQQDEEKKNKQEEGDKKKKIEENQEREKYNEEQKSKRSNKDVKASDVGNANGKCDEGEERKMEVDDSSTNGYQEQKEENPTVQDKQIHSLNQHDNDTYDGMKGSDMANDRDKLQRNSE